MALEKLWNYLAKKKKAPYSVTNTTEGNPPANRRAIQINTRVL